MRFNLRYWAKQAGIGLVVVLVIALAGHLNYAQFRLMPGMSVADWYFVVCWLCFPFAKWAIVEDNREVTAPTIRHHKKRRASETTASVYEKAHQRQQKQLKAAPKTALSWYWLFGVDVMLGFLAPVILGGWAFYSLRHN